MRNYLFRGKRLDSGEWIEGYLFQARDFLSGVGHTAIIDLDAMIFPKNEIVNFNFVDHKTIGQYTDKHDKHGTKIFEGDVVQAMMDYGPAGMALTNTVIHWNEDYGWQWGYFDMDTILVIGNIHDNPDIQLGLSEV